jgi:hypothetical protein
MRKTINGKAFEIPDAVWVVAGMSDFVPQGRAFRTVGDPVHSIQEVPIIDVEPPDRAPLIDENRMLLLLKQFSSNEAIYNIQVEQARSGAYKYTVYHGVHRYYASAAAGYLYLPVIEMKPEDMTRLREVFQRKR